MMEVPIWLLLIVVAGALGFGSLWSLIAVYAGYRMGRHVAGQPVVSAGAEAPMIEEDPYYTPMTGEVQPRSYPTVDDRRD